MAWEREEALIEQILEHPEGCDLHFGSWNDAVSAQAGINRYLKFLDPSYAASNKPNPLRRFTMRVERPSILRITWDATGVLAKPIPSANNLALPTAKPIPDESAT